MNSIPITENTTVKLIVRSGTEMERRNVILSEGEPGYTLDTQRFFVGDGRTPGGINVSTRFIGEVGTLTEAYVPNSPPLPGDLVALPPGVVGAGLYILKEYPLDLSGRALSSWGAENVDWYRLVQSDYDGTSAISAGPGLSYTYNPVGTRILKFDGSLINVPETRDQVIVGEQNTITTTLSGDINEVTNTTDSRKAYSFVVSNKITPAVAGGMLLIDSESFGSASIRPSVATICAKTDDTTQPARTILVGTKASTGENSSTFTINESSRVLFTNGVDEKNLSAASGAYVGFMGNPAANGGAIAMVHKPFNSNTVTDIFKRFYDGSNARWAINFDGNHTISAPDINIQASKTLRATALNAGITTSNLQITANDNSVAGSLTVSSSCSANIANNASLNVASGGAANITSGATLNQNAGSTTTLRGNMNVQDGGVLTITSSGTLVVNGNLASNAASTVFDRLQVSDINAGQSSYFTVDTGIVSTFNGTIASNNTATFTSAVNLNSNVSFGGSSNTTIAGNIALGGSSTLSGTTVLTNSVFLSGDSVKSRGKFVFDGNGGAQPVDRAACAAANANTVLFNSSIHVGIDGKLTVGQAALFSGSATFNAGATISSITVGTGGPTISNASGIVRPSRFGVSSVPTSSLPVSPVDLEIVYDHSRKALLMYAHGAWQTVDGVEGDIKQTTKNGQESCYRNPGWAIYNPARGRLLGGSTEHGIDGYTGGPFGGQAGAALGWSTQRGGEINHTLTVPEMPSHKHGYVNRDGTYIDKARFPNFSGISGDSNTYSGSGGSNKCESNVSISYTGGNAAHNTIPSYIAFTTLVKDYNTSNGTAGLQATINAGNANLVYNG